MGSGRVPSWSKSNCTGPHFRMALTTGASSGDHGGDMAGDDADMAKDKQ